MEARDLIGLPLVEALRFALLLIVFVVSELNVCHSYLIMDGRSETNED